MRAETRRQLKEDRFSKATLEAAEATAHWSVEHQSKLMAAGVVLLVVIAAGIGVWYYLDQQDQKAGIGLSQALRTLDTQIRPAGTPPEPDFPSFASDKERATEAHKQFQAIVDQYPHAHSADFARYFLGRTSADLGDNAAAEREFKDVASSGNKDLSSLAQLALASVYRTTGRNKEAIEIYKKLADKPTNAVGKATAQLELADTYQADQQPLEAKRVYEQVQKENPSTQAAQIASAKLTEIKQ